jgi:hypothetical protein
MNASDEARIIVDALSFLWPDKKDIMAWADRRIAEAVDSPSWVVDLSTLNSSRLADYISILTANQSDRHLTTEEKILMCLDSYQSGALDLSNTLGAINTIWLGEDSRGKSIRLDQGLEQVCGWWELVDGHGDVIGEDLVAAAHNAFEQFRQAHRGLRNPLPELKTKKDQQDAPSIGG